MAVRKADITRRPAVDGSGRSYPDHECSSRLPPHLQVERVQAWYVVVPDEEAPPVGYARSQVCQDQSSTRTSSQPHLGLRWTNRHQADSVLAETQRPQRPKNSPEKQHGDLRAQRPPRKTGQIWSTQCSKPEGADSLPSTPRVPDDMVRDMTEILMLLCPTRGKRSAQPGRQHQASQQQDDAQSQ